MEKLNILFLGGAKRVSMARHFKRAARALGREAVIFSYEINRDLPISTEGTVIQGVRYGDSRIYDDMRRVCEEHDIHIIVPFIDGMIDVADNFARMDGVHVFSPTCAVAAALHEWEGEGAPDSYRLLVPGGEVGVHAGTAPGAPRGSIILTGTASLIARVTVL